MTQVTSFVNSSYPNTHSAVVVALVLSDRSAHAEERRHLPPDRGDRQGQAPSCGPRPGAPVTLCTNHCGQEIIEAIIKALGAGLPRARDGRLGPALPHRHPGQGPAQRTETFIWHLFQARPGGGASPAGDGWPGGGEWQAAGGIKFGSLEVTEVRFPLFFRRHEFRPNSGGDGEYRGGPGGIVEMVVGDRRTGPRQHRRRRRAPRRLRHPRRRATARRTATRCYSGDREPRPIKTKEIGIDIRPGDRLVLESGGGGGWGDPARRTRAKARAKDRESGFVRLTVYRIGIDVGGTFTDLVAIDDERRDRRSPRCPRRPTTRRSASSPASRSWPRCSASTRAALLRGDRAHRPRHHGRDQRAARAQGREGSGS